MAGEVDRASIERRWGPISQTRGAGPGAFTSDRVERIIEVVVGPGCLVFGLQAFIASLAPAEEAAGWHLPLVILTFAPLLAMVLAAILGRAVRLFAGIFAVLFIAILIVWPFVTAGSTPNPTAESWIFYLLNVATVAAVLAFPLPLQITWAILTPLLYGLVRLIQGSFAPDMVIGVLLNVSFAIILGSILVTLGWVFRAMAVDVDKTRAEAVTSYARAAAVEAAEQERVSVGALMHDSVLAALIAASRANSPRERTLAVSMAREALTRLANTERDAGEGPDELVSAEAIAADIETGAAEVGVSLTVTRRFRSSPAEVPGRVARALVLAATQAIANTVQHANAAGLAVSVTSSSGPARVGVLVRDGGPGFRMEDIPADRLGISASIVARVAAVGGQATVDSSSSGTAVSLEWGAAT